MLYIFHGSVKDGCKTIGGHEPDQPCMFPFYHNGVKYQGCTSSENNGKYWWSTAVDENDALISEKWGNCNSNCYVDDSMSLRKY